MSIMPLGTLISRLFELNQTKSELSETLSELNKEIDNLEYEILNAMEENGVDQMRVPEGSVSKTVKMYPKIEDFESFMRWCVANDRFDMIQKRANEGSFREFYEQNNCFPDGMDSYQKSTLNRRRS